MKPVIVGISGASGSLIAKETIDSLLGKSVPTIVVCSNSAKLVWHHEVDEPFAECLSAWKEDPHFSYCSNQDMSARIASGTFSTSGMVIVPCSMASVASISHGLATNLLLRAADVCLKERRTLIIVPRETPLHAGHLENLARLARMGAVIMPPEPAFYLHPETVGDIVRFVVGRILVSLGVTEELPPDLQYSGEKR